MFNIIGLSILGVCVAGRMLEMYYTWRNERNEREAWRVADERYWAPEASIEVSMTLEPLPPSHHHYRQMVEASNLINLGGLCTVRILVCTHCSDLFIIPDNLLTSAFGVSRGRVQVFMSCKDHM